MIYENNNNVNEIFNVNANGNIIYIEGVIPRDGFMRILATFYNVTAKRGYQNITVDFSKCVKAFPGPMLAICSQARRLWSEGVDISLILPEDKKLSRMFMNANWAHLIDPRAYEPSIFNGHTHVPASVFKDGDEQFNCVQTVLNTLLGALKNFDRDHLKAIEWSINELTDNVINHSESKVGGIVQLSQLSQSKKAVQFVVADAGVGIPTSLRTGHPEITSDQEALDQAIREGVTRGAKYGQGNGLYGSWKICELSHGEFQIYSGYAHLSYGHKYGLHVKRDPIPYNGTIVSAIIRYDTPLKIEDALRFKGKGWEPVDFIELNYDLDDNNNIKFKLAEESRGFGSRQSGKTVRNKIKNILHATDCTRIIIDFEGVALVSSSYADEVFGKLFAELGAIEFSSKFEFKHMDKTVKSLIDRAVQQRLATGM